MALSTPCSATSEHPSPGPDEPAGFLFYAPAPLPAPKPEPFAAQVMRSVSEGFLQRMAFAAWFVVALYVLYLVHKHQVQQLVFTELRSAR